MILQNIYWEDRMKNSLLGFMALISLQALPAGAQSVPKRLAILPFSTLGVDDASTLTSQSLLRQELEKIGSAEIVSEKQTLEAVGDKTCFETDCAVAFGRQLAADQVLLCSLNRLGEKVIVQYLLVDVAHAKNLLSDNTTSSTIEDLETVMKRVALCVNTLKPFDESGQVGLITQKETLEPRRKSARKYMGLSFGYLYPQERYDGKDRNSAADLRTGFEMNQFTVGSQLAVQKGFAWNIYGSYLFTGTDVCPYLGAALGFHWVSHESHSYYVHENNQYSYVEDKREGDGFEARLHSGLRLFRTYNFQVLLNLEYAYTFNDFNDKAIIFTIGLLR